jgi:hypothetical protein
MHIGLDKVELNRPPGPAGLQSPSGCEWSGSELGMLVLRDFAIREVVGTVCGVINPWTISMNTNMKGFPRTKGLMLHRHEL